MRNLLIALVFLLYAGTASAQDFIFACFNEGGQLITFKISEFNMEWVDATTPEAIAGAMSDNANISGAPEILKITYAFVGGDSFSITNGIGTAPDDISFGPEADDNKDGVIWYSIYNQQSPRLYNEIRSQLYEFEAQLSVSGDFLDRPKEYDEDGILIQNLEGAFGTSFTQVVRFGLPQIDNLEE